MTLKHKRCRGNQQDYTSSSLTKLHFICIAQFQHTVFQGRSATQRTFGYQSILKMLYILRVTTVWWIFLLSRSSTAYELQDTIHTLKEENLQLQHRLENLTRALRELKHLLAEHSKGMNKVIPEQAHILKKKE